MDLFLCGVLQVDASSVQDEERLLNLHHVQNKTKLNKIATVGALRREKVRGVWLTTIK